MLKMMMIVFIMLFYLITSEVSGGIREVDGGETRNPG